MANMNIAIQIAANTSKAMGPIGSLKATLGGLGNIGKTVLTTGLAAATGGIIALGAGLVTSVGAAMDAQKGQAELNAVLASTKGVAGMTADAVNALASKFQALTPFEDDVVLAGENMLLTFTNIGKDVFPMATEAMLNMGQKFGSVDAAAVQLGKALNDPIAGVSALRKVGVTLTETQEEQIKAFMAVGDIASAQKIILGELETEFGGLAVAAGNTLPGKIEILKNTFGDIQETIGAAFLPILTEAADLLATGLHSEVVQSGLASLTDFITSTVVPGIRDFGGGVKTLVDTFNESGLAGVFDLVGQKWDAALPVLEAKFSLWMNSLHTTAVQNIPFIHDLENAFNESGLAGVFDLVDQKWEQAGPILQARLFLLTNTVKTSIAQNWPGIEAELDKWATNIWDWLGVAATNADGSLRDFTRTITTWINTHQTDIMEMGATTGGYLYDGLTASLTDAEKGDQAITAFATSIGGSIARLTGSLIKLGFTFASGFLSGIISKWTGTEPSDEMMRAIKDALVRTVTGMNPLILFTPVGEDMMRGIKQGILNGLDWIRDAARDAATSALDAAKHALGINSPSTVAESAVGHQFDAGVAKGIFGSMDMIQQAMSAAMAVPAFAPAMGAASNSSGSMTLAAAPAGGGGGGITIGSITIQAGTYEEGQAAGRGFVEELRSRGLL